ncbi:hypothetical protein ES708_20038 [subsurface metagenome]
MTEDVIIEIKNLLVEKTPRLTPEQKSMMYKIINPDISNYVKYGVKVAEIENIVKNVYNKFICTYQDAIEIFKTLTKSNVEEEKFAAFFFLNRFKKNFNEGTIHLFGEEYAKHCHTWSHCDSTCVRVIGPFLGKQGNEELAKKTIDEWSNSDNIWIKRASMVILLKITMIRKDFDETFVFELVDKMLKYSGANYIEKGIGWLLKTCSKYKPEVIIGYLTKNKKNLSGLILRYASEKLPKEKRAEILNKRT